MISAVLGSTPAITHGDVIILTGGEGISGLVSTRQLDGDDVEYVLLRGTKQVVFKDAEVDQVLRENEATNLMIQADLEFAEGNYQDAYRLMRECVELWPGNERMLGMMEQLREISLHPAVSGTSPSTIVFRRMMSELHLDAALEIAELDDSALMTAHLEQAARYSPNVARTARYRELEERVGQLESTSPILPWIARQLYWNLYRTARDWSDYEAHSEVFYAAYYVGNFSLAIKHAQAYLSTGPPETARRQVLDAVSDWESRPVWISTLHDLCLMVLKAHLRQEDALCFISAIVVDGDNQYLTLLQSELGVSLDASGALRTLHRLADEEDHLPSIKALAGFYWSGTPHVLKNHGESARYEKLAARAGDADAALNYALHLMHGVGVERNYGFAMDYVKLSAHRGNPQALEYVSQIEEALAEIHQEQMKHMAQAREDERRRARALQEQQALEQVVLIGGTVVIGGLVLDQLFGNDVYYSEPEPMYNSIMGWATYDEAMAHFHESITQR